MAKQMNEDLLKKLNENLEKMNGELKRVTEKVQELSQGFGSASLSANAFSQNIKAIAKEINSLKQFKIEDAIGVRDAKVKLSELHEEIFKLKGDLRSGTEGSVSWNAKSGNFKYRKGSKALSSEEQLAKQERYNRLLEITKQLEKGEAQTIIDLINLKAKQQAQDLSVEQAKQNALKKSIELFNQYGEKYKELGILIKQETDKKGILSPRGEELKKEQDTYLKLAKNEAKEIREARLQGVKLTQQEEMALEVRHRQNLRKIQEYGSKENKGNKGTVYAQRQAAIYKQISDLSNKIVAKNRERLDLESKLSKLKEGGSKWKKTKADLEDINRLLSEYAGKLYALGGRGQAGVKGFLAGGVLRSTDINIGQTNDELDDTESKLKRMIPTVQRLASAFGVAFSVRGLVQFGKKLIETRGEYERQQVALRSILQNKQLADEIWDKTMKAALQSPFTAMQLTRYTKQLAAYRIETDKLFETTKRLADVSAGLGVDMDRLILAYGQVKAANYLRASEIRQFTEAGVNILGELRDYFNKTKGMAVNTAQVMEMVTKRMVKFEDVEAIFKRMTDQGGIFYNMQETQSKTVRGQIQKLHDAYDQMLNSIGKANQGTLKNLVATLNNIVRNWRSWAVVLKSIGWAAAIGYMSKFAFQLMGISTASEKTLKSLDKLKVGLKELGTSLKANWASLVVAGVTALIATFVNLDKKMRQVNHDIDEQNLRLYQTKNNFEDLKSQIEENNEVIRQGGTATKSLNDAQQENEGILKKLGDEYPQMAEQMEIATNGIIEMNGAIDQNIRKLNEQRSVQSLMKQSNWFTDSGMENLSEFEIELSSIKATLLDAQTNAQIIVENLETANNTGHQFYEIYKEIATMEIGGNVLEVVERFEELQEQFRAQQGFGALPVNLYQVLGVSPFDMQANWSQKRAVEVIEKSQGLLKKAYIDGILDNKEYVEKINTQYNGSIKNFVQANAELLNEEAAKGINRANETLIKTLGPQTEEMRVFLNNVLNRLWETVGIDYFKTADSKTGGGDDDGTDKQGKIDDAWRRRIGLLEEMKKRYDELAKSAYGFKKSEDEVRKAFEKSFGEIFKGTGISMSQIDFTSMEGMKKSTELALSKARGVSDAVREEIMKKIDSYGAQITIDAQVRIREDFGRQMEAALGDYEITLELDKLNLPKGLAEQLWGVSKTQLPDLRAQLTDMYNGLRDENGQLSEEAFKDYEKYLNKIDDLERKMQRDRLRDYSKYLEAQYSDRVKLEMEYVRKLAGLEATSIPEAQKKEIREGLQREFLEKSRKQDFEDFKGSEFYVQMMEDLEKQGTASLEVMKKKLLEMRANAENLSPRALKEVVRALEKIDDIERSRNKPLARLTDAMKDLRGVDMEATFKSLAANQEQLATYEEQEKELERMIMLENERLRLEEQGVTLEHARTMFGMSQQGLAKAQENLKNYKSSGAKEDATFLAQLEQAVNNANMQVEMWQLAIEALTGQSVVGAQKDKSKYAGWSLSQLREERKNLKEQKKNLQDQIDSDEKLVMLNKELNLAWQATWESVKDWGNRIQSVFDGVMDHVEYFTDDTYGMIGAWKEFGDTSVSAMNELVSGIQAYQAANAEAEKNGAVTGLFTANGLKLAMVVLGVIVKVVQSIAKLHDARQDAEIERQQEKIDALARAYERLEKSIEKTFDTLGYMKDYNEMTQNMYERIQALNAQIAAEEAKKNSDSDKIQGYRDAVVDLEDGLEDLKQQQIEVFGGIGENSYRSAAEEFVSAWKDAFLETGDGLQGLQDHFDEFLNEWFVKQATMRIAGGMLEPLFRQIDQAVDQYSAGENSGTELLWRELKQIKDQFDLISPELSRNLEELYNMFGIGGEGGLSGLAAGIQGMTEEQANILEAYWNSVRGYTESIDANVATIVSILRENYGGGTRGGGDLSGSVNANPMLQQMTLVAQNTRSINALLQSVTKSGHAMGGSGIKVFLN